MLVRMDLTSERSSVWDILFKGQVIKGKICTWTNQPMASPYNIKQNGEHFKKIICSTLVATRFLAETILY